MDEFKQYLDELESQKILDQRDVPIRTILINAIKMQALYSDGKLRLIESSDMVN